MTLYNPNVEKNEKAGTVYMMRGKKQTAADKLIAGDIGRWQSFRTQLPARPFATPQGPSSIRSFFSRSPLSPWPL
jgi:hypothetical protein